MTRTVPSPAPARDSNLLLFSRWVKGYSVCVCVRVCVRVTISAALHPPPPRSPHTPPSDPRLTPAHQTPAPASPRSAGAGLDRVGADAALVEARGGAAHCLLLAEWESGSLPPFSLCGGAARCLLLAMC